MQFPDFLSGYVVKFQQMCQGQRNELAGYLQKKWHNR